METIKNIDIRHFKLTSGEDLICYVQSTTEHAFIVERPAAVKTRNGTFTFDDWFPFSDKKIFKIMKRFIINHVEVVNETKESYIKYSCQDEIKSSIHELGYNSYDENDEEDPLIEDWTPNINKNETIH
jgi:hypothetical protein